MDYEVSWTQTDNTAAVKAAQRHAVPRVVVAVTKPGDTMRLILGVMRLDARATWTAVRVRAALPGAQDRGVRNALTRLVKRGDISGWQEPWPCKHGYRMAYRVRLKVAA